MPPFLSSCCWSSSLVAAVPTTGRVRVGAGHHYGGGLLGLVLLILLILWLTSNLGGGRGLP